MHDEQLGLESRLSDQFRNLKLQSSLRLEYLIYKSPKILTKKRFFLMDMNIFKLLLIYNYFDPLNILYRLWLYGEYRLSTYYLGLCYDNSSINLITLYLNVASTWNLIVRSQSDYEYVVFSQANSETSRNIKVKRRKIY